MDLKFQCPEYEHQATRKSTLLPINSPCIWAKNSNVQTVSTRQLGKIGLLLIKVQYIWAENSSVLSVNIRQLRRLPQHNISNWCIWAENENGQSVRKMQTVIEVKFRKFRTIQNIYMFKCVEILVVLHLPFETPLWSTLKTDTSRPSSNLFKWAGF